MKLLMKKCLIFLLLFLLVFMGFDILSMTDVLREPIASITDSEDYINGNVGAEEIIPHIKKVQEKNTYTKLIVGDSVCGEMYSGLQSLNDVYCITGTNAAITMAGQYLLVQQFLENHEHVTDVYLFVIPTSLESRFSLSYGYQYVVMPFIETDLLENLMPETRRELQQVYGNFFVQKWVATCIDKSAINRKFYLNILQKYGTESNQDAFFCISVPYILKMKELCEAKGATLHLCANPVSDKKKSMVQEFEKKYKDSELYTYFPDYLSQIAFYPEEHFRDGTHFGGEWRNQAAYNDKIRIFRESTQLLQDLVLE